MIASINVMPEGMLRVLSSSEPAHVLPDLDMAFSKIDDRFQAFQLSTGGELDGSIETDQSKISFHHAGKANRLAPLSAQKSLKLTLKPVA